MLQNFAPYIIAGILAGFFSIGAASLFNLNLNVVVIVSAGLAAFIAGVIPRAKTQSQPRVPSGP